MGHTVGLDVPAVHLPTTLHRAVQPEAPVRQARDELARGDGPGPGVRHELADLGESRCPTEGVADLVAARHRRVEPGHGQLLGGDDVAPRRAGGRVVGDPCRAGTSQLVGGLDLLQQPVVDLGEWCGGPGEARDERREPLGVPTGLGEGVDLAMGLALDGQRPVRERVDRQQQVVDRSALQGLRRDGDPGDHGVVVIRHDVDRGPVESAGPPGRWHGLEDRLRRRLLVGSGRAGAVDDPSGEGGQVVVGLDGDAQRQDVHHVDRRGEVDGGVATEDGHADHG